MWCPSQYKVAKPKKATTFTTVKSNLMLIIFLNYKTIADQMIYDGAF